MLRKAWWLEQEAESHNHNHTQETGHSKWGKAVTQKAQPSDVLPQQGSPPKKSYNLSQTAPPPGDLVCKYEPVGDKSHSNHRNVLPYLLIHPVSQGPAPKVSNRKILTTHIKCSFFCDTYC